MDEVLVYDTKELQQVLKCGKQQAYALMRSPEFPSMKINTKYIVEKKALEEWLKQHRYGTFLI